LSNQTFTLEQVIRILQNSGIDTTCPACADTAFTGSTTSSHSCAIPIVKDTVSAYPYGLEALDPPDPADDTEPLFTLRGQDLVAPEIVREWAFRSLKLGSPIEKVDGARRIANAMENWQIANDKRKVAD